MKYLLVFLAALVADTPGPRVTVTTVNTQGPNFWVKIAVTVQGNPDSVLYSVRQGTSTVIASSRRPASVLRDSFSLVKPPIGGTATGNGCAQAKRRGLLSGVVCRPYSYTTPDAPPPDPVIDVTTDTLVVGLTILPRAVTLVANGISRQQWCPIYTMGNGKRVMPTEYATIPYCGALYDSAVPLLERASISSRRAVDRLPLLKVAE